MEERPLRCLELLGKPNLGAGSAKHVYEVLYCARGHAENLIKLHKRELASDRTSCRALCIATIQSARKLAEQALR